MKKFYQTAHVEETSEGFTIKLDDRPLKTPAKNSLVTQHYLLAVNCAKEWNAVTEIIRPQTMPITGFLNASIDKIAQNPTFFREKILAKLRFDMFFYRADPTAQAETFIEQNKRMKSAQTAFENFFSLTLTLTSGFDEIKQPEALAHALGDYIRTLENEALTIFARLTDLTDSVILTFCRMKNFITSEELYGAANCEEEIQFKKWGVPEEARSRLENLKQDFQNAERFLEALRQSDGI